MSTSRAPPSTSLVQHGVEDSFKGCVWQPHTAEVLRWVKCTLIHSCKAVIYTRRSSAMTCCAAVSPRSATSWRSCAQVMAASEATLPRYPRQSPLPIDWR